MGRAAELARSLSAYALDAQNNWFCPLSEALKGLSAARAAWTPAPDQNSIWSILNHIRIESQVALLHLRRQPVDYAALGGSDGWPPAGSAADEAAWQEACRLTLGLQSELAHTVAPLTDADLAEPVKGWPTREQWLQGLVNHTSYHTGQIVFLRRLQGSWQPLQWLPPQG
ncbi:MAG: DinB family protein [Mycobacterium leprae]